MKPNIEKKEKGEIKTKPNSKHDKPYKFLIKSATVTNYDNFKGEFIKY